MNRGLYIHIPFCERKCPYCDFYSVSYEKNIAENYKNAVIRNLKNHSEVFDTVYFGGGTPILLWQEICEILSFVNVTKNAEITLEANPCCTNEMALKSLKNEGVNRISFGVQSLNDSELKFLGRKHDSKTAVQKILLAKKCGFENISADLMLGLPNQTEKELFFSIENLSKLPLSHISTYILKIEENTPFYKQNVEGLNEEKTCNLYLSMTQRLKEKGYLQYEISNFAKQGYECRHNLKYWRCEEYLGIGAAAHSYYEKKRFCVSKNINEFINSEIQITEITDESPGGLDEFFMLKMRLSKGVNFSELDEKFANELQNRIKYIPKEYINFNGENLSLTPKGFLLSNTIIGRLLGY